MKGENARERSQLLSNGNMRIANHVLVRQTNTRQSVPRHDSEEKNKQKGVSNNSNGNSTIPFLKWYFWPRQKWRREEIK